MRTWLFKTMGRASGRQPLAHLFAESAHTRPVVILASGENGNPMAFWVPTPFWRPRQPVGLSVGFVRCTTVEIFDRQGTRAASRQLCDASRCRRADVHPRNTCEANTGFSTWGEWVNLPDDCSDAQENDVSTEADPAPSGQPMADAGTAIGPNGTPGPDISEGGCSLASPRRTPAGAAWTLALVLGVWAMRRARQS